MLAEHYACLKYSGRAYSITARCKSQRRNRRNTTPTPVARMWTWSLVLFTLLCTVGPAKGTVTIPTDGKRYDSQPAMFGKIFEPGVKYRARLQQIERDPFLCGGGDDSDMDDDDMISGILRGDGLDDEQPQMFEVKENFQSRQRSRMNEVGDGFMGWGGGWMLAPDARRRRMTLTSDTSRYENEASDEKPRRRGLLQGTSRRGWRTADRKATEDFQRWFEQEDQMTKRRHRHKRSTHPNIDDHSRPPWSSSVVVPPDGSPVVLLAKRGQCSFERKARTAMAALPEGVVKYVIVYDDVPSNTLSPMSAAHPSDITVGALFVSLNSGMDLLSKLVTQPDESRQHGGFVVILDSVSPWIPSIYDDPNGWVFLSLSGMILFVLSVGCLLMCFHTGYIRREGNVIIFGQPNIGGPNGGPIDAAAAPPLSRERVLSLPVIVYEAPADEESDGLLNGDDKTKSNGSESVGLSLVRKDAVVAPAEEQDAAKPFAETPNDPPPSLTSENNQNLSHSATSVSTCATSSDSDHKHAPHHHEETTTTMLDPQQPCYYENFSSCTVCLEDYEHGEHLRLLPCGHTFHTECILPWLTERHSNCPLCKAAVLENENQDEDVEGEEEESENDSLLVSEVGVDLGDDNLSSASASSDASSVLSTSSAVYESDSERGRSRSRRSQRSRLSRLVARVWHVPNSSSSSSSLHASTTAAATTAAVGSSLLEEDTLRSPLLQDHPAAAAT